MSEIELSKATRLAGRLAAYRKGHNLAPFRMPDPMRERWVAHCNRCKMGAVVWIEGNVGHCVGEACEKNCAVSQKGVDTVCGLSHTEVEEGEHMQGHTS